MSRPLRFISKLQGRRVLVLGGTSGIGFAVAEAALEHGAHVVVSSSNQDKVDNALQRLRRVSSPLENGHPASGDAPATGATCDVGDAATIETNLKALLNFATSDQTQLLDHVVFTAGDPLVAATYGQSTAEELQRRQFVRVIAPSILGKLLPGYVRKAPTSSYTLTSSVTAVKPPPLLTAYTAQTVAVQGLARGLAVELKPVRVNAIEFGLVPTELHDPWPQQMKDVVFTQYGQATLTGSTGDVVDAAEPYLFCMKNAFITGTSIVSDGGNGLV
ncbi:short-chain dehydrogenase [Purpureocillium lavendulum]|uniref:Short-chain dehydrogenase n=1 Tax=Purpureocillium lavendulum TaxID=1247861 RepID=A0AB34FQQ1_9HYPO|nr:short-chain dehydrogenase [Purpureocillium lavendulum]